MFSRHNYSVTIFVWFILWVQRIGVYGALKSPRNSTIIDMAKQEPDTSVSVEKRKRIYSHISLWSTDSETIDCSKDSEICISLCCNVGEVREYGNCLEDHSDSPRTITVINEGGIEEEVLEENSNLIKYDPCVYGWMTSAIINNFTIYKNGTIHSTDFNEGNPSNFQFYCLMREPQSFKHIAKMCHIRITRGYYEIVCVSVAIIIMLSVLIVFTALPELRNLHGLMFRCYVASYIGVYIFALGAQLTAALRIHPFWFTFVDTTTRFFSASCAFWLNVMSYNIWRSFRHIRSIACDSKEQERRKFIRYAIYAWCSPLVLLVIAIVLLKYVPYLHADVADELFQQWGSVAVITLALSCNIYLHTSIVLTIKQQRRNVADLTDSTDNNYAFQIQWFHLYLKLFVIMGGHLAMWPVRLVWHTRFVVCLLTTLELLQTVLIFIIFILKDNVVQSLGQRFGASWMRSNARRIKTTYISPRRAETR